MHAFKAKTNLFLTFATFMVAAFFSAVFAEDAAALSINDVRVGQNNPVSRVVIELDQTTKPKVFTLTTFSKLKCSY